MLDSFKLDGRTALVTGGALYAIAFFAETKNRLWWVIGAECLVLLLVQRPILAALRRRPMPYLEG